MPHLQPLVVSKVQGFVCRSCLSKLRIPRNQRPPWLSRSVANKNGPEWTKKPKVKEGSKDQHERESEPVFRIFDQSPGGVRTEVANSSANEAFVESLKSTIRDVKQEMGADGEKENLDDEELQDRVIGRHMQNWLQREGLGDSMASKLESQMDQLDAQIDKRLENVDLENLSEEELAKIRQELYQLAEEESPPSEQSSSLSTSEARMQDLSIFPPVEPELKVSPEEFPIEVKEDITSFNRLLQLATKSLPKGMPNSRFVRNIWMAYNRCRGAFLSDPSKVSIDVWQFLWHVSANQDMVNNKNLKILGQDMTNAGLPLQDWQQLFYIQAIFAEGDRIIAIEQWKGCEMTVGRNSDTSKDYWELGITMYCEMGQLDEALKTIETLVRSTKDATAFRMLIPIMHAFLSLDGERRGQQAWALYIRLRLGLGSEMEMKDYDAVASMFLTANLPDLALGVFKDMMLTGDSSARQHDSIAVYRNGPGVKSDLDLMKIGEKELTWEDSRALAKLPAKFNNKFFFGKWLKKLIAEGEFNASIKVFNLMHDRGISMDPRYLNGLIGAWLRNGTATNRKLAEDTGWRMIRERLEYVKNRDTAATLTFPLRGVNWQDKADNKSIFHHPMATAETFSVLMEDYRRRRRHDRMKDLFAALQQAKIMPSTYFMNQLIMVDSEIRQYWAWDTYISLTRNSGVHPDFETYAFLWFLAKHAVDPLRSAKKNIPKLAREIQNADVPRYLFAEMVKWAPKLNKKEKMPRELYDIIILSFSLAQDQAGTAVALSALHRHFNMLPNEDTVRTVVLQLARAGLKDSAGRSPRRLNLQKSAAAKERVGQVTKLLESFKKQRVDNLLQQGIILDELQGDARLKESLLLMSDLLRHATQIRFEEENVAQLSKAAANEMGVPSCTVW